MPAANLFSDGGATTGVTLLPILLIVIFVVLIIVLSKRRAEKRSPSPREQWVASVKKRPKILPWVIVFLVGIVLFISGIALGNFALGSVGFLVMLVGICVWPIQYRDAKIFDFLTAQSRFVKKNRIPKDIEIRIDAYRFFCVDKARQLFYCTPLLYNRDFALHRLDVIESIELLEDDRSVVKSEGGTGGAIVGGLLFGAAGAVIGASTKNVSSEQKVRSLYIRIITSEMDNPTILIKFLDNRTVSKDMPEYGNLFKTAEQIYATLRSYLLVRQKDEAVKQNDSNHYSDELRQLSSLLEDGIITQAEFDSKKRQILKL